MKFPVTENWSIFIGVTEKSLMDNHDSTSSWTKVLLGTHESHIEFIPRNWLGSDVGAHITDDWHALRNKVPWESIIILLESVHSLIAAEIEE